MATKIQKTVLITDLDNTLYDWFSSWHAGFSQVLELLQSISGIPEKQLLEKIKRVHERHRTSEYSFLLKELEADGIKLTADDFTRLVRTYQMGRDGHLKLYPTVLETLSELRRNGTLIVAYTESISLYTTFRLSVLELDGLIDIVYFPETHDVSDDWVKQGLSFFEPIELEKTLYRYTPRNEVKPNPKLLTHLIRDIGASKGECVYVGDSLMKDVAMAEAADVDTAHAGYDVPDKKPGYNLLQGVTHWSVGEVQKEISTNAEPKIVLTKFGDLTDHFEFGPFQGGVRFGPIEQVVDLWKKTVDVQMHFNDTEMKIRGLAITLLTAMLTVTGFAIKEKLNIVSGLFFLTAAVWSLFYVMDEFWYHRLLKGSVVYGERLEQIISRWVPGPHLTECIGAASPVIGLHSKHKIRVFYWTIAALLLLCGWLYPSAPTGPAVTAPAAPIRTDSFRL